MAAKSAFKHGPLPLTIGTTGHRDLIEAEIPLLEERVREFLARLQDQYPHTKLQLLSALAEGSDRLVARVARDLGISLLVPLPMPREDYLADFDGADSRAVFDGLLASADKVVVIPGFDG